MRTGGENVKSVKEHKAKGNYRPSRHEGRLETKVNVLSTVPEPPAHFDQRHRNLWQTCCKEVFDLGVLVEPDVHLIEVFVCSWFLWQDAIKDVQVNGYTVTIEVEKGVKQVPNPAIRVMNDSSKLINQIADKFGFSPRSRMGIKTQEKPPEDPLAKFLNN